MKNNITAIASMLINKGLLSEKEIVDGHFQVTDISRRNQNYRVECGDEKGFLIKQVKSSDPQAAASFQCEAAVHWLAQNDPDFASINALSPRCRGYDPKGNVLVIDLVNKAETLTESLMRGIDDHQTMQIGQLLATAHWHTGTNMLNRNLDSPFNRRIPWTLTMQTLPVAHMTTLSEGNRQLLSAIQSTKPLSDMLTAVHSAWSTQAFIHGDLKPDNCLVRHQVVENESCIQFIDWELADFGDPAWDLAALLQGIWTPILLQVGYVDESFGFIQPTQHLTGTLMKSYLANSTIPVNQWSAMRLRAIQFTGARMVQTAYEMLHDSEMLTPQATLVLQAALCVYTNAYTINARWGAEQ